jgi:3-oxoacyl-[acyl-carrier protein] reductase
MDLGIDGRVALVVGASSGIGRGIAAALAAEGARVAIASRSRERIEAAAAEIGATGLVWDTGDLDGAPALVDAVERALGPVDILVCNTGGPPPGADPLGFDRRQWEAAHRSLVQAPLALVAAVVPGMRERGWGRILFVSSLSAFNGGFVGPHYAAAKAGQIGLMHSLAGTLAPHGVTVNTIAPALIATDGVPASSRPELTQAIPVGRRGQPEEVADLALAIIRNAYLTAQTILIDGGIHPR